MAVKVKKYTHFRPRIKSRHPSHSILRKKDNFPLFPFKSVIRLGSSTEMDDTIEKGGKRIEINTVKAIKNSSNKLKMKTCFINEEVKTADWWVLTNRQNLEFTNAKGGNAVKINDLPFPIISKHIFGSRGRGNIKHDNVESLQEWLNGKTLGNYIFEKFYNYNREYRLHVTEDGCFYTCRKMLKTDTPDNKRWYRNDDNCVWIMQSNDAFDKPSNWGKIEKECVKALKAVGLDFGAVDLRIQSSTNKKGEVRNNPEFIIVEINSAPSFGEVTAQKYIEELPKLLQKKYNNDNSNN